MDKGLTRLLPVGAALAAIAIAGGIIVQRALADDSGDLIVPTLYGELQGKSLQTTDAWLGIPYARAPVGAGSRRSRRKNGTASNRRFNSARPVCSCCPAKEPRRRWLTGR